MFQITLAVAGIIGFAIGWFARAKWGLYKTHRYFKRIQKEREENRLKTGDEQF